MAEAIGRLCSEMTPIQESAYRKWRDAPHPTAAEEARVARSRARNRRLGGDLRGSAHDRHRRKLALLLEFGDGRTCPCAYCGKTLDVRTLTQDRIHRARGYRLSNLLPACFTCNRLRSDHPPFVSAWEARQEEWDEFRRAVPLESGL